MATIDLGAIQRGGGMAIGAIQKRTITRYVNTDSSGGNGTTNDTAGTNAAYLSLAAWESAEQADLVAQGDSHIVNCDGTDGDDTANFDLDGWTTGVSNDITIQALGDARNNGVSKDNAAANTEQYMYTSGQQGAFRTREDFVNLIGFEIEGTGGGAALRPVGTAGGSNLITLDSMLIRLANASTSYAVGQGSTGWNVSMVNTLVISVDRGVEGQSLGSLIADHCGIYATTTVAFNTDSTSTVTNCWAFNTTTADFSVDNGTPTGSNNASEDTSADTEFPTDSINSLTPSEQVTSPSTTSSSFDFTLLDADLVGAGNGALATDITGATRTGDPDIGPFNFEEAAAAGNVTSGLVNGGLIA